MRALPHKLLLQRSCRPLSTTPLQVSLDFGRWRQQICKDPHGALHVTVVEKAGFSEWLDTQCNSVRKWLSLHGLADFKDDALLMIPGEDDGHRGLFLTEDASKLYAFSSLPSRLGKSGKSVHLEMAGGRSLPESAFFSWAIGCYAFSRYKFKAKQPDPAFAKLVWMENIDVLMQARALDATFLVRDLVNIPAENLGPADFEAVVRSCGSQHGAHVEVTVGDELLLQNYPQIHAVGRAAANGREPRLIDLRWGQCGALKVTLVGKAVCYDTGGLSIKPTNGMLNMKKDMGGAAQVLGLAQMIMAAKLPVQLRVLMPTVENDITGGCLRPGDVLIARDGRSTEVVNTDAEGRLILADALVEACADTPDLIIDCATLTGARTVALGLDIPVLLCNKQAIHLAAQLQELSAKEDDQVWQLPLWHAYRSKLDSSIADIKNAGGEAGAITAGLYLHEFVSSVSENEPPPWLHLDLSAWRTSSRPGRPEGGDAMGMRALFRLIEKRLRVSK